MRTLFTLVLVFVVGTFSVGSPQAKELKPDPNAVFELDTLVIKTAAGEFNFTIEVADDERERNRGLMFRETMLPTHGMLFDFGRTAPVQMWMKNTILPLDMIFVRPDGTVATIETDTVPQSLRIISSGEAVSHTLELNAGTTRLIGLRPGDTIIHKSFGNEQMAE